MGGNLCYNFLLKVLHFLAFLLNSKRNFEKTHVLGFKLVMKLIDYFLESPESNTEERPEVLLSPEEGKLLLCFFFSNFLELLIKARKRARMSFSWACLLWV